MREKLNILHLITDLNTGGAETMLLQVATRLEAAGHTNRVISLTNEGEEGRKLKSAGVPVFSLQMHPPYPVPRAFFRLAHLIRQYDPDVMQTWMYHADLLGGLSAQFAGRPPVVWGIHNTYLKRDRTKLSTIWTIRLCAFLSRWISSRIVSCSEEGRIVHIKMGYDPERFRVIPNGIDIDRFHPDLNARKSVLQELELPTDTFLIGLVARFDPLKDHQSFIKAASIFQKAHSQANFLLCGEGISWTNESLAGWIKSAGNPQNYHLLGRRDDIPRLMAAMDVNTLSSLGESFPNVLGEAMACETPCVSTNVGDAAEIIKTTGIIVPANDPEALSRGWEQVFNLTSLEHEKWGRLARERIRSNFEISKIIHLYETLYLEVARNR